MIILGNAPTNLRDQTGRAVRGRVEGITTGGEYGGTNPADDSGILRYVRIELRSRSPNFKPRHVLSEAAALPPNDGFFDAAARYIGAFRAQADDWDSGGWAVHGGH